MGDPQVPAGLVELALELASPIREHALELPPRLGELGNEHLGQEPCCLHR
ncbi:MAG: hypothetical protein BIP78_0562 [Candidatus Bipolaricaulis sibiricus]|uniref:Uncharacterized protein n=1 Tax=Bipolaricaulis sibiricus TaxID=2501609 RepID=A0A410FTR4_BIPS1|nr:MAG: hypothetical protein BIP78_0562 [Candidatus Bipolaricaulis sibiricus]